MATNIDPFTSWSEIECRDGKKRKVYPAKLKYKDEIRDLSEKFNDTIIVSKEWQTSPDNIHLQ